MLLSGLEKVTQLQRGVFYRATLSVLLATQNRGKAMLSPGELVNKVDIFGKGIPFLNLSPANAGKSTFSTQQSDVHVAGLLFFT